MLTSYRTQSGFSLLELSIGLLIVATLLTTLLVPIEAQVEQRRFARTERILEQAQEALVGFVIGRRRFPCPATDTSNGREALDLSTYTDLQDNIDNHGICVQFRGYLPAVDLGLSPLNAQGFLEDGYGGRFNRVRYAVSAREVSTDVKMYTTTGRMTQSIAAFQQMSNDTFSYLVCSGAAATDTTSCTVGVTLANGNAVAVVWSAGKSDFDQARALSTDEARNQNNDPTNRIFISRTPSEATGNEFDDIVRWISPNILIGRLSAAGLAPASP